MRRIRVLAAGLLAIAVSALPALAAQAKVKNEFLPNGTVTSVSSTSLVVSALGKDSTFAVDATTRVVGKGVGTNGIGGTMHASKIEVASKSAR
jgi:hypothetical protein